MRRPLTCHVLALQPSVRPTRFFGERSGTIPPLLLLRTALGTPRYCEVTPNTEVVRQSRLKYNARRNIAAEEKLTQAMLSTALALAVVILVGCAGNTDGSEEAPPQLARLLLRPTL
jgi:hypothetical protein